jgi:hypothetical protein
LLGILYQGQEPSDCRHAIQRLPPLPPLGEWPPWLKAGLTQEATNLGQLSSGVRDQSDFSSFLIELPFLGAPNRINPANIPVAMEVFG